MTENAAPPSAPNGDSTRGIPYYEKLKRDLRETLIKKRQLDKNMASLEEQIYRFETSYLEETGAGNIIRGFDGYIKGTSTTAGAGGGAGNTSGGGTGGGGSATTTTATSRRKGGILELDRVFSRSSASFMRETSPSSSAPPTPSHAPTPTSSHPANPTSARESKHPTPSSATSTKATGGPPGPKKGRKAAEKEKDKDKEKEEEEGEGKQPKRLKITYMRGAGVNGGGRDDD